MTRKEKVAAYYQKALAKYGTVLNCSDSFEVQSDKDKDDSSKKLTCEDDHPEPGGMLFKAGSKEKQHISQRKAEWVGLHFSHGLPRGARRREDAG